MTREQTIKSALKFLVSKQQEQGSWGYADNDNINKVPWDEALEWIDKQPCGDCISRQKVLNSISYEDKQFFTREHEVLSKLRVMVSELPSVEPERKTGKWIDYPFENVCGLKLRDYRCNLCAYFVNGKTNYCPNCGAKMEV